MGKLKDSKNLVLIRITEESRDRIKLLAEAKGLKMVSVLEYILSGKIKIEELSNKI